MPTINLWGDEPRTYRLSAAVYALRDGKAAFLQRAGGVMIGFWSIPGGGVDPGEDPLTAALRELREESSLDPTGPVEYLCALPLQGRGGRALRFVYVAPCEAGDITLSHEHSDGAWLAPEDYRAEHLNDDELARWTAASPHDGFNVRSNRASLDTLTEWLAR